MAHDTQPPFGELAHRSGRPRTAPIEEALPDLPVKTQRLLRRAGVRTLGDLLDRGEAGSVSTHDFGPRTLALVKASLLRSMPSARSPEDAILVLRALLDQQELYTRPNSDRRMLDVRHHRPGDLQAGPTTRVTAVVTPEGSVYEIAPARLPGRETGQPFTTLDANEAVDLIRAQTLFPYECLMDCGNPAGVACAAWCQSFPDDRYTPPPSLQPELAEGGGLFTDEPPFPDPWAPATRQADHGGSA